MLWGKKRRVLVVLKGHLQVLYFVEERCASLNQSLGSGMAVEVDARVGACVR